MADKKISALADGAPPQATDELVVARAGTNVRLAVSDLTAGSATAIQLKGADGIADASDLFKYDKVKNALYQSNVALPAGGTFGATNSRWLATEDSYNSDYQAAAGAGFYSNPQVVMMRGTFAAPLAVQAGDVVWSQDFVGYVGAGLVSAGFDVVKVVSAVGPNDIRVSRAWQDNNGADIVRFDPDGSFDLMQTNSAAIGAVQIDKPIGRCNIAAGQASVVVTNALVTANSQVLCTIATDDATAIIKNVVPGAGAFTIKTTAAVTGNTAVNFMVINPV